MKRHLPELGLIAVAVAPLFLGLRDTLFETDPAQYAEVARRMLHSADPFSLHDNFGVFLNKPPMTMWAAALAMKLLGVTSAAFRLPALVFALGLLAAVWRIGELLWDRTTGLVAVAFTGASFSVQLMVLDPKVDAGVTCFMALTVWALLEARRRPRLVWLAWAFAAAGILTKGPIGLAALAAAVAPEALRRRWGAAEPGAVWQRILAFKPLSGLALLCALMATWYTALIREHGWAGAKYLLWEMSFSRVLHQSDYHNATTPLFFLHTGLWAFLPFTPVLLFELATAARGLLQSRRLPPDEARVVWWWLLIPFAVISLAEFRLPQYLYWLAPPAALLSARAVARVCRAERSAAPSWLAGFAVAIAVAAAALAALALVRGFPPSSVAAGCVWLAVAGLVPAGLMLVARRWEAVPRLAGFLVASTAGLALFYGGYLHATFGEYQPAEAFGARAKREEPKGAALPFVALSADNATAYYADRPATEVGLEGLADAVRSGRVTLAVTETETLPKLAELGLTAEVLEVRPSFPVSRPTLSFLDARTRPGVVRQRALVRLGLKAP